MSAQDIVRARLHNQRLTSAGMDTPEDVVRWLGAVQAQDFPGAKWSLGQRVKSCVEADVEQAYAEGRILRTHILRPTWHFVAPEDIRWMQRLTAPRVHTSMAYYNRILELDSAVFSRSEAAIEKALRGGRSLTRPELAARMADAGIEASGQRLGHIVMNAELERLICSGPMKGKQHTYSLLDERVPQAARDLTGDEALADLTLRFFTGHGPATARDLMWWSSLTAASVREGLGMMKDRLVSEEVDGQTYWSAGPVDAAARRSAVAFLVPEYDESHIAYKDLKLQLASRAAAAAGQWSTMMERPVVIDGFAVGTWKRTIEKRMLVISVKLFAPPTLAQSKAIQAAVDRHGKFLGMPARLDSTVA